MNTVLGRHLVLSTALLFAMTISLLGVAQELSMEEAARVSRELQTRAPNFTEMQPMRALAKVDDGDGGFVEWLAPLDDSGEIGIGVMTKFPNKPMVGPQFMDEHTPLEVFLAVGPSDMAIPRELLERERLNRRLTPIDKKTRTHLQYTNKRELDQITVEGSAVEQSCSPAFVDWAGDVFGDSTCGTEGILVPGPFEGNTFLENETYCTSGCDHPLGEYDAKQCQPTLQSCDIVRGQTSKWVGRATQWALPYWQFAYFGRQISAFATYCSGGSTFYPLNFVVIRGNTGVQMSIKFGHGYRFKLGSWNPATAASNVTYGSWTSGIDPNGPDHLLNRSFLQNYNPIPGSPPFQNRSIYCVDVRHTRVMSDISDGSCHGSGVSLCTGGGDCTSACFHCAGGAC